MVLYYRHGIKHGPVKIILNNEDRGNKMELISFDNNDTNAQGSMPLQPISTCQPIQQPMPNWEGAQNDYMIRANIDRQNKVAMTWAQEKAKVYEHWAKQKINEESKIRVEEAKADIQIKKDMLSDTVRLTEEGVLIRIQEYLTKRSIEYGFANFRVDGCPIRYVTEDCSSAVLCLRVILQGRGERVLCLDLEEDRAGYYKKKFRKAGIEFKNKRSDKKEMIFDIVQVLDQAAEIVTLPLKPGFYRTRDQSLHYADRKALLWKEVKKYAL